MNFYGAHQFKFFLFISCYLLINWPCWSQWKQEEFIIGTYLDPRISEDNDYKKDSVTFSLAKEAHFNLLTGYRDEKFTKVDRNFKKWDYELDLASRLGLKLIVADERFFHLAKFDSLKATSIQTDYLNLSPQKLKALYGYRLIDEPAQENFPDIKKWVSFFNKVDPRRIAYINLLPSYGFEDIDDYKNYLYDILHEEGNNSKVDLVSYDSYPFVKEGIRPDYFYNLYLIKQFAGNRPLWYYPYTSKHLDYLEPSEEHFRFMAFCPVAYGAKGIIYFTYESISPLDPYHFSEALIASDGKPTPKYYYAKKINNYLEKVAGPIIMNSQYQGTYHIHLSPEFLKEGNETIMDPSVKYVSHVANNNILLGIFTDKADSTGYIFAVNKSLQPQKNIDFYLKENVEAVVSEYPSSFNFQEPLTLKKNNLEFLPALGTFKYRITELKGGDMTILKVKEKKKNILIATKKLTNTIKCFPNPATENSIVTYTLSKPSKVTLRLLNSTGSVVKTLVRERLDVAGDYFINLETNNLSSGIYLCTLTTEESSVSCRVLKI